MATKLLIAALMVSLCPFQGVGSTIVTLAADPFPPYINIDENEVCTGGLYVDIVREIFRQLDDVDLKLEVMPWSRCLKSAQYGEIGGILMLLKTPEREAFLDYTAPILREKMRLWCSRSRYPGGISWTSMEDLEAYTFAVKRDYAITPEWDETFKKGRFKVSMVRTNELALKMLSYQRVDLVPIIEGVAYSLINQNQLSGKIMPIANPLGKVDYFIGFSKKSEGKKLLIPQINDIAQVLVDQGFVEKKIRGE